MITAKLSKFELESVGEDIGENLGARMVKDFQDSFPDEISDYFVGRKIIDNVLKQPDCVGIRFYAALNEIGEKTFVYVGINSKNEIIDQYSIVDDSGTLAIHVGIVGDRFKPGGGGGTRIVAEPETTVSTGWAW
jgi:hypothetical protein